jgi:hypothetical protein
MYLLKIFLSVLLLIISGVQAEVKELPDPFIMNDGSRAGNRSDWEKRREELKEKIQFYEYGHFAPPSPVTVLSISADSVIRCENGLMKKRVVHLQSQLNGLKTFTVNLFIPDKGEGPFPVIIAGDLCWGSLLKRLGINDLFSLVNRGYIITEFDRTEFSPDENVRANKPDQKFDTGAVVEWAWGFQRVVDYILTLEMTDRSKIIVTGHSRGGKAALLAGAFDERIALVAPNCSGAGGAGPSRFVDAGGEKLDDILTRFPYWFSSNFKNFIGDEKFRLPFDQHSLISLVAPRAYLCTNGLKDKWANPLGTAQAHMAAKEVFTALGAQDKIGIFFINSGHDHNIDKWIALLDFSDGVFFGKQSSYDYNSIPFPDMKKAYTWSAPVLK